MLVGFDRADMYYPLKSGIYDGHSETHADCVTFNISCYAERIFNILKVAKKRINNICEKYKIYFHTRSLADSFHLSNDHFRNGTQTMISSDLGTLPAQSGLSLSLFSPSGCRGSSTMAYPLARVFWTGYPKT